MKLKYVVGAILTTALLAGCRTSKAMTYTVEDEGNVKVNLNTTDIKYDFTDPDQTATFAITDGEFTAYGLFFDESYAQEVIPSCIEAGIKLNEVEVGGKYALEYNYNGSMITLVDVADFQYDVFLYCDEAYADNMEKLYKNISFTMDGIDYTSGTMTMKGILASAQ